MGFGMEMRDLSSEGDKSKELALRLSFQKYFERYPELLERILLKRKEGLDIFEVLVDAAAELMMRGKLHESKGLEGKKEFTDLMVAIVKSGGADNMLTQKILREIAKKSEEENSEKN